MKNGFNSWTFFTLQGEEVDYNTWYHNEDLQVGSGHSRCKFVHLSIYPSIYLPYIPLKTKHNTQYTYNPQTDTFTFITPTFE